MARIRSTNLRSSAAYAIAGLGTIVVAFELIGLYLTYELWYLAITDFCNQFVLFGDCGFYTFVIEDGLTSVFAIVVGAIMITAGVVLIQTGRRRLARYVVLLFGLVVGFMLGLTLLELASPGLPAGLIWI